MTALLLTLCPLLCGPGPDDAPEPPVEVTVTVRQFSVEIAADDALRDELLPFANEKTKGGMSIRSREDTDLILATLAEQDPAAVTQPQTLDVYANRPATWRREVEHEFVINVTPIATQPVGRTAPPRSTSEEHELKESRTSFSDGLKVRFEVSETGRPMLKVAAEDSRIESVETFTLVQPGGKRGEARVQQPIVRVVAANSAIPADFDDAIVFAAAAGDEVRGVVLTSHVEPAE